MTKLFGNSHTGDPARQAALAPDTGSGGGGSDEGRKSRDPGGISREGRSLLEVFNGLEREEQEHILDALAQILRGRGDPGQTGDDGKE